MAAIIQPVISTYYKLVEEPVDPRVRNWLFLDSPFYMIAIIILYNYFIRKLGPQWMENREPYNLDWLMIIHNIVLLGMNGWFVIQSFRYVWLQGRYNLICEVPDPTDYHPTSLIIANYCWMFFMSKMLDLLDTVFMVLRKKGGQMTFLHVYHHSGMVFAAWMCARYVPGGHPVFFGTVNSFVHTVMYAYYLITTIYPEYKKNVWWKKYITQMQMVQFVVTTIHCCLALFNNSCTFPKFLLLSFVPQDIFMFLLFMEFYKKAYSIERMEKFEKQEKLEKLESNGKLH